VCALCGVLPWEIVSQVLWESQAISSTDQSVLSYWPLSVMLLHQFTQVFHCCIPVWKDLETVFQIRRSYVPSSLHFKSSPKVEFPFITIILGGHVIINFLVERTFSNCMRIISAQFYRRKWPSIPGNALQSSSWNALRSRPILPKA
jgi:hypothetical protein